jgi:hypothetical protein
MRKVRDYLDTIVFLVIKDYFNRCQMTEEEVEEKHVQKGLGRLMPLVIGVRPKLCTRNPERFRPADLDTFRCNDRKRRASGADHSDVFPCLSSGNPRTSRTRGQCVDIYSSSSTLSSYLAH